MKQGKGKRNPLEHSGQLCSMLLPKSRAKHPLQASLAPTFEGEKGPSTYTTIFKAYSEGMSDEFLGEWLRLSWTFVALLINRSGK